MLYIFKKKKKYICNLLHLLLLLTTSIAHALTGSTGRAKHREWCVRSYYQCSLVYCGMVLH